MIPHQMLSGVSGPPSERARNQRNRGDRRTGPDKESKKVSCETPCCPAFAWEKGAATQQGLLQGFAAEGAGHQESPKGPTGINERGLSKICCRLCRHEGSHQHCRVPPQQAWLLLVWCQVWGQCDRVPGSGEGAASGLAPSK